MGKRVAFSDNHVKILGKISNNLHGLGMSQLLPYAVTKFVDTVSSEKVLFNSQNSDTGYVLKGDLGLTDKTKMCPRTFHFLLRRNK